MKTKILSLLPIMLCLLLAGCSSAPKASYTIRFSYGNTVIEQVMEEGTMPDCMDPADQDGMRFVGWTPEIQPAAADIEYRAVYAPVLNKHVPFLFADKEGFLHPDAPLTYLDMNSAITVLAADGARNHYTLQTGGVKPVTGQELKETMRVFFPDTIEDVFSGIDADAVLTRGESAQLMCTLMGRDDETVQVAFNTVSFPDTPSDHACYAALMEAALPHNNGTHHWDEIKLKSTHEPGWELKQGKIRYFDEQGYLVRNTVVENSLTVDENGYYTSGSEELDALVTQRIFLLQQDFPNLDRLGLLRPAFEYARDYFFYLRKPAYEIGYTGWEVKDAITMLNTGRGNCYNYAAVFWALARGLGFDAQANAGRVGAYPHGWVTIIMDDVKYFFDPELEMAHRAEYKFDWDLFMMPEDRALLWDYHDAVMEAADAKLRAEAAAAQAEAERIREEVAQAQMRATQAQNDSYIAQNNAQQAEMTVLWTKSDAERTQANAERAAADAARMQEQADTAAANAEAAESKAAKAREKADSAKEKAALAQKEFEKASQTAADARENGKPQELLNELQAKAIQAQQDYYILQSEAIQAEQEAIWAENEATQAKLTAQQAQTTADQMKQQADIAKQAASEAAAKAEQAQKDAKQAKADAEKAIADAAQAREEATEKQAAAMQS